MTGETISLAMARRLALAAQGFGRQRPVKPGEAAVRRTVDRLRLLQIDSVNVVVRAHYLPLFSRLGGYPREVLERAAWGRPRRFFEYWAHEASLLPLDLQPLLRWRMARAERGQGIWANLAACAGERRHEAEALLARIRSDGPVAASDVAETRGEGGWWGWSDAKRALEWLFWAGLITAATRRNSFERVYDLPERVLPAGILALPTPSEADAHRALIAQAARALGIATAAELRDYFRLKPADADPRIAELVEAGTLRAVVVSGWPRAYLHTEATAPRRIAGDALLAPFDPLIWERGRTERLFGLRYRIEIYTPAHLRQHGYYVLPFLQDGRITARVDLKSDRTAGRLVVRQAHPEAGADADTPARLAAELGRLATWLSLSSVIVDAPGQFAEALVGERGA